MRTVVSPRLLLWKHSPFSTWNILVIWKFISHYYEESESLLNFKHADQKVDKIKILNYAWIIQSN